MTDATLATSAALTVRGTYNLRGTGGYPAEGGAIRTGALWRSDALSGLSAEGRRALRRLNLGRIVDLRDDAEVELAPSRLGDLAVDVLRAPVYESASPEALALAGPDLSALYRLMVDQHGSQLTRAVRLVAEAQGRPVLVHCTAGKDRTGLVVALALGAVGVPRDVLVADYARSEEQLSGAWADAMLARLADRGITASEEIARIVVASPPSLVETALDRIDDRFGSAAGYLLAHGLEPEALALLRAHLVEPSPLGDTP